jgi:ABC-type Fe3+-hydroxamate transport system substrate-binding protein
MPSIRMYVFAAAALALAACGTRSSSDVQPVGGGAAGAVTKLPAKAASDVIVTEDDITDRPYRALGDVEATVAKWTIFDSDPTPQKVAEELRRRAADMGADAVVLVRYGTVGVGAFTWGKLEGKGRAVVFTK